MIFEESVGEALYQSAMEAYDLGGIYKAKGNTDYFARYRRKAWLLAKEAAYKMLSETEPVDPIIKEIVILNAAGVGFEQSAYQEAKKILELGLLTATDRHYQDRINELLAKVKAEIKSNRNDCHTDSLVGTLIGANIENNVILLREDSRAEPRSIKVKDSSVNMQIGLYLGKEVIIRTNSDPNGELLFRDIQKAA